MAETEPFVWGAGGAQMTPASIAAQRKVAEALMAQGMDASPVRHWTQGLARVAQAALGTWDNIRADKAELANQAADKEMIAKLIGGATQPAPAVAQPSAAAPLDIKPNPVDATVPIGQSRVNDTDPNASAIAGIESGGKYDKLGPIIASGSMAGQRALGKYQVMESNVGPWTKQYLGQAMTPEQFLNSPEAQDAVFKGEFGRLSAKHGPEGAARAWFAGEGGMNNPNARDQLGTTVRSYGDRFTKALGPQVASLDPNAGVTAPSPAIANVAAAMTPQPAAGAPVQPAPVQTAQAQPNAAGGLQGVNPALLQAITSPYASDGVKKIAGLILQQQMGDKVTYQTLPDGTILALDPHGRQAPRPVYSAPVKPELKEAGTDPITGQKNFQVWNPKSQTLAPVGGNAANPQGGGMLAPGVTVVDHSLVGEDYLKQFSPEVQSAVKAYINGDVMPSGNPRLQGAASFAKTIAQKYGQDTGIPVSDALYSQRRTYRSQVGSNSPSSAGGQAKAFNQGIEHMGALADTLEKLDNSNGMGIPIVAGVVNSVRQGVSTEQSAIADKASSIGQTLAGEVGKLFSGSAGGGVHERQMTRDRFDTVKSKPQLAAALEATLETMRGGLTALEQRRDEVLGPNSNVRFVNPETEAKIAKIEAVIERLKKGEAPKAADKAPESGGLPSGWSVKVH